MGGAGFTEMLLLAVIALIVVGPHRLPTIARTAGRLTRQARHAWQGLQSELQAELDADHNRKIMENTKAEAKPAEGTEDASNAESSPETATESESEEDKRDESADRN